jgi:hypothetical protein
MTKAASRSMAAALVTVDLVRTLAAEALVMLQCLLVSRDRAQCRQVSHQPRHNILRHLQASAAHALALRLPHLARPAPSTHRLLRVCLQRHPATTRPRLRATLQLPHDTRQHLHRSLRPRRRTVLRHQRILEPPRRTTALHHPASVPHRHSTVRRARSSTPPARGVRLLHRRRPPSVLRARLTHRRALLATHNIPRHRLGTLQPLRARHHTLQTRGGRRLARRTRLRKSPLVIVGPSSHAETNFRSQISQAELKYHSAYLRCTYGT